MAQTRNEKDEQTAGKCISKLAHFSSITANILNTELYDDTLHLPLTNKTFIEVGEKRIDNIKSISNLEIKPHTENEADEKHKAYIVTFDVEYATEGAISNGGQYWICNMVYESDNTGWKIASFGH